MNHKTRIRSRLKRTSRNKVTIYGFKSKKSENCKRKIKGEYPFKSQRKLNFFHQIISANTIRRQSQQIFMTFGPDFEEDISHAILAPIAVGFSLMMIVYNYGYISLAMYNPAVTLAHIIRDSKTFPASDYLQWTMYFIAQFAGGIAGGFWGAIIGGHDSCMVYTHVNPKHALHEALLGEFFFCTVLVSLNLHLATDKRVESNQFYGLAIGACLLVSILAIAPITGSAINPAVWAGTVASAAFCDDINVEHCWIYWVAHILAGCLGGAWFRAIYGDDQEYAKDAAGKKTTGDHEAITTDDECLDVAGKETQELMPTR
eukprot:73912_1